MANNDFLVFDASGVDGTDQLSQSDYAAAAWRPTGFATGILPRVNINKPIRQASIMASMIGQVIVDHAGVNATDDGTTATLETNFIAALAKMFGGGTGGSLTANPGFLLLPAGFILNFGNVTINANTTDTIYYAKSFLSSALVAMTAVGSTSTSTVYGAAGMNIRQAGATLINMQISNPNNISTSYDWAVLGV